MFSDLCRVVDLRPEAGAEADKWGDEEKGVGAQTDVGVHATLR